LSGDGDPNGYVNANLKNAFAEFKSDARGVVLDHRAGNGGTLDGAETATFLIRPPEQVLVFMSPMQLGGFDGPTTPAEGVALFDAFKGFAAMTAGSVDWDPDMPVALLLHRDGSASDFMPYAFKGAPKTRIFGPSATAGAFSTFWEMTYWGGITFRYGSGDSIGADGATLIGHGAEPDVIVMQKQSDSLAGLHGPGWRHRICRQSP
jgi:C-terminal processing protease CtpA/Prc